MARIDAWWDTSCPDWKDRIVDQRSLIRFDPLFPAEAESGLNVFNNLVMADVAGSPRLGSITRKWAADLVSHVFGSYDAESGRRLINQFFLLLAKKNGKSSLSSGIMMTALIRNWRDSGEFQILAPTKEVADNSFGPALDMIRHDNELSRILHAKENQRIIRHRVTNAELKVVAADSETVAGGKAIGTLIEEVWAFGKRADAARMLREATGGMASRAEGFVIYITTQSDQPPAGVFDQLLTKARRIRDGLIVDPKFLPLLYEYPEEMVAKKAYLDPKTFYIPNPNLGASVDEEEILYQFEDAKRNGAAALADYLAKRLNVQIGVGLRADGWAGATVWERGTDKTLTLETLLDRSEVVVVSMDGGGLDDLLGIAVLGREKETGKWLAWGRAFIAPEGMSRRAANAVHYEQFIAAGDLVFVPSLPNDVDGVIATVSLCLESGKLHAVGLDPAALGILVDELASIDVTVENGLLVGVKQGVALIGAIKACERKLVDGTLKHADQAMMTWCAGNAVVVPVPTGIRVARDASGYGKIDPLMALFNCCAMMSLNPQPKGEVAIHAI